MNTVTIQWGTVASREGNPPKTYEFNTQAELNAFLFGISEMDGWMEYQIVDPDEVVPEDDDFFQCEHCLKYFDIEDSIKRDDVYFCPRCAKVTEDAI